MIEQPPLTTVQSEQVVYDGRPWLSVARHRITTPDGVERTHHAVRLNPVATVTVIDEHGRALLMWRHRWIVDQIGFESPGGILEPDEEPEVGARRELFEETGFTANRLLLVGVLEPMPGLVQTPHYIYIGQEPQQVGVPADPEEVGHLVWIPLATTGELLATGQIMGTGTAVGMLAASALHGGRQVPGSPGQQLVPPPEATRSQDSDSVGGHREQ
ncbi:NUDIX hydrolase [Nocardia gipuzkoensis]